MDSLLERAAMFFRQGKDASGSVMVQEYMAHPERKDDSGLAELGAAMLAGDFILAADIIEEIRLVVSAA